MKKPMITTYILLGSNLDDPMQHVLNAITEMGRIIHSEMQKVSHLYRSKPLGGADQPDYINAVAQLDTSLSAHELLKELHTIENAHGRVRKVTRWGPRTLDLDILLYGDKIINTPTLIVPHPEIPNRNFVIYPLLEIAPQLILPNGKALTELCKNCSDEGLKIYNNA